MKKIVIVGLVVILFSAGLAVLVRNYQNKGLIKNVEMLDIKSNVPITIEKDIEYFPGTKGYFVRPIQEGIYPGVVMIHENRGLRPEILRTAEQLAKEGYLVLAVDLFNGKVVETQDDARQLTANFKQETGIENMKAAVMFLKNKGAAKIGSLGWCFGGRQSLQLALSGEQMDATVIYYGQLVTEPDQLNKIKWPILGIFGDKDQVIPMESINKFSSALDTLGIKNEIYVYPGVGHAFANPSGMNYAPNETKDAWLKTMKFLNTYLKQ